MKLISLNTWGGRGGHETLLDFFRAHADTEFFALQEIWSGGEEMVGEIAGSAKLVGIDTGLLTHIQEVLPNHTAYFRPHFKDYYGLLFLVRNDITVIDEGELFVYKERGYVDENEKGNHARNLQYVRCETPQGVRVIAHVHGLWNGKGKGDSEDRILQSKNIVAFTDGVDEPLVLAGDFNLRPDTESVRMLEDAGLRNLVTEYSVPSTRTSLYTKSSEPFADYVFTRGVDVQQFEVLPDEVSDHAALLVEFI